MEEEEKEEKEREREREREKTEGNSLFSNGSGTGGPFSLFHQFGPPSPPPGINTTARIIFPGAGRSK